MNFITIKQPLIEALGWTLLNSLWQGAIIALILAIAIRFTKSKSPQLLYQLCCLSLISLVSWMAYTFNHHFNSPFLSASATADAPTDQLTGAMVVSNIQQPGLQQNIEAFFQTFVQSYADELVMVWLLGVLLFGIKWAGTLYYTYTLKHQNINPVSKEWQKVVNRFARQLGIKNKVRLLESTKVDVPLVIGCIKPVILIPASVFSGFTPEQIESVIVHELAHIKSNDFLVGLILSAMEVVLFYHPLYWWVTGIIMEEREKRCDDIAVEQCGNPLLYARTLFSIAEHKQQRSLALSLQGKKQLLFERIKRICISPQSNMKANNNKAGMALGLLFIIAIMAVAQVPTEAKEALVIPIKEAIIGTFVSDGQEDATEKIDSNIIITADQNGIGVVNPSISIKADRIDWGTNDESGVKEITDVGSPVPGSNNSHWLMLNDTIVPTGPIVLITRVDREGNTSIIKKLPDGSIHNYLIKSGQGNIYIDGKKLEKGNHRLSLSEASKVTTIGTTIILDSDEVDEEELNKVLNGEVAATQAYDNSIGTMVDKYYDEDTHINLEEDQEELEAMREEIEAAHEEMQAEMEEAHEEREAAHEEMEAAHEEMEAVHEEMEAAREEMEEAREEMEEAEEEEIEGDHSELERTREELAEHHKDLAKKRAELAKRHNERMAEHQEQLKRQQKEHAKNMEHHQKVLEEQQRELHLRLEEQRKQHEEAMEHHQEAIEEHHKKLEEHQREKELQSQRNDKFHDMLGKELKKDGLIKRKDRFKFKLNSSNLKVNGKTVSAELHTKYLKLYEDHYDRKIDVDSYITISKY